MTRVRCFFIIVHIIAAFVPLAHPNPKNQAMVSSFSSWPKEFEGRELERLHLTEEEELFRKDFPGHIARFTDGEREIIIRWLKRPTRKLHPAADCLRGVGYKTIPKPIQVDYRGNHWGCVSANRGPRRLKVCERVFDAHANSYSDVSSWFWGAILGRTTGPWWAVTVAEKYVL